MKRGYHDIIYGSQKTKDIVSDIRDMARTDARILITGESGTGKELLARTIHDRSPRRSKDFVTINCPALTETLLESELFGHYKGSFTDAKVNKPGLLEHSNGGTLFIDEVSEASPKLQGIFLRFLETGEIQKVGSQTARYPRVDTRVISASNRDLNTMVQGGEFRRDLYFRLGVLKIHLPPLRDRPEDIPILVDYFARRYSPEDETRKVDPEAMEYLTNYHWPGNVRQLENAVEAMSALAKNGKIELTDVVKYGLEKIDKNMQSAQVIYDSMRRNETNFWSAVFTPYMSRDMNRETATEVVRLGLEEARGNYRIVARLFGIEETEYKRMLNFLRKHNLQVPFKDYRF